MLALSWGPWDAPGMVTDEIKRQFSARGVVLVDPAAGARAFLDELRNDAPGGHHAVLGAGPWVPAPAPVGTEPVNTNGFPLATGGAR